MSETSHQQLEERLRGGVRGLLAPGSPFQPSLGKVVERIRRRGWSAALFGGSLRDLLVGSSPLGPRDFDLVVAAVTVSSLEAVFAEDIRRRTRFGGLHLLVEGVPFDVWPLEQTWAFQAGLGLEPSFAALPRTTFLNVEAVAVEITGGDAGTIHEAGAFASVLSRTLEINFEPNPTPLQCVVRSLATARRLGFGLGPGLARYLVARGAALSVEELTEACKVFAPDLRWNAEDLQRWLDALADWVSSGVDMAIDLNSFDRWLAAR
jgi:hypothetical protein